MVSANEKGLTKRRKREIFTNVFNAIETVFSLAWSERNAVSVTVRSKDENEFS